MSPTLQALGVLAQILGIVLGTMFVATAGFAFFLDVWAKRATRDHIFCFFLEQRKLTGRLLKVTSSKVSFGRGTEKEEYLLDHNKQFWSLWPPGIPSFLQVPVRAHIYVRYNPEPFDPENMEAMITSKSLRIISDEAMLKQTWKDVRDSTGARAVGGTSGSLLLVMVFIALIVTGFNTYMTLKLSGTVSEMLRLLGG